MTLRFTEGFDTYANAVDLLKGRSSLVHNTSSSFVVTDEPGRFTGTAMKMKNGASSDRVWFPTYSTDDTLVLGFAFNGSSTGNGDGTLTNTWCGFHNGQYQTHFQIKSDGSIDAYNGDSQLLGTTTFLFSAGTWYYVEVKVKFSSTVGKSLEVH